MKLGLIASAVVCFIAGAGAASAQSIAIGATYDCAAPVPDLIVESCSGEYCHVQLLNAYAPDGHGAALDMYRSMVVDRIKDCTPSGGAGNGGGAANAQDDAREAAPPPPPRPAAVRRQAAPNPAYIAGAGAGVRFNRPGGAPTAAARLVPNSYYCTAFIGPVQGGHMATMPGFTILPGGRYRHQHGSTGTVSISGNMIEFHGGALDGQAATYDAGATGRGTVHLYNASRSRTVIDCDGHV